MKAETELMLCLDLRLFGLICLNKNHCRWVALSVLLAVLPASAQEALQN